MNPDAPQQVFVMLLGVAAIGLVAATAVESGVLSAGGHDEVAAAPVEVEATEPVEDREESDEQAAIDSPSVAVDSEPIPVAGSGLGSGEGSGEAEGIVDAPTDGEPAPEWQPLSRADDGATCLVRANRAVVANGIDHREPTGTAGPFEADGEAIITFMDFANSTGVSQPITVVWLQGETGASFLDTTEAGPGSRWRTWVERPLPLDQIGPWTVQILDDDRCLIDELSFDLVAPDW